MKVKAKTLGYYGDIRRKPGDVFDLVERTVGDKEHRRTLTAEQQFSETWMERLDGAAPQKKVPPVESVPHDAPQQDAPRPMDRPVDTPAPKSSKGKKK